MSSAFPTKRLADLAQSIDYGVTASATKRNTGTKFLRITDIQDGAVDWSEVPFCEAQTDRLQSARLDDGDIVFARTGATTGKSFLIRNPPKGAVFASYLIRVRPSREIDAGYLAHFFQSHDYWSQITRKTQGAAQGGVNATSLGELNVPIAELNAQRRIAMILDKADMLRRRRRQALNMLRPLREASFLQMFGDPSSNPRGWKRCRIGDLLSDVQYGTSAKAGNGKYPILRMGNLTTDGRIDFKDLKYIDISDDELDRFTLKRGDILFNRTNSAALVGKTAVFDADGTFSFAGYLVRARVKDRVSPHYISGYLNSAHGKATLRGMAKSIIGMANINAREMQAIPVLLPSFEEQERFSRVISATEDLRANYQRELATLERLFSSLQCRAFSGGL